MKNEEKKEKVPEKDLETMSGGCGSEGKVKRKYDVFQKVGLLGVDRWGYPPKFRVGIITSYEWSSCRNQWNYKLQNEETGETLTTDENYIAGVVG